MKLKITALTFAMLTSSVAFAKDYIRLENAINVDTYKMETQVSFTDNTTGIFSLESNNETAGLDYNLLLAYTKYTQPFSDRLIGEFDFGIAYETTGELFGAYAKAMNISDDFQESAGAVWGAAALNYFVLPNFIANVDFTATHDVYNETIVGMYRTRAKFIYQPIDRVNLIYRAGLTYAQSEVTKQVVKGGSVVSDDYIVSHEFYMGYASESGLEPYLMLKDMANNAHYDVILGFYYRFN